MMTPPGLQLPGTIHVAATADELYDDLALALMAIAVESVAARGVFQLALSGGSTPEPFYMRLVTDPRFRAVPWRQTHAWMVDERRVAEDDPKSNFGMIRETLLDHVPIRKRQVHPMPVLTEDPATIYEKELAEAFELPPPSAPGPAPGRGRVGGEASSGPLPRLDWVLLGMGDDGHTASLFPGSPALHERWRWIAVNDGPGVTPPPRVTMTYPLLNAARNLAVLVVGARKAITLQRIASQLRTGGPDPEHWPITGVQPDSGTLAWYLDAAAAGVDGSTSA